MSYTNPDKKYQDRVTNVNVAPEASSRGGWIAGIVVAAAAVIGLWYYVSQTPMTNTQPASTTITNTQQAPAAPDATTTPKATDGTTTAPAAPAAPDATTTPKATDGAATPPATTTAPAAPAAPATPDATKPATP